MESESSLHLWQHGAGICSTGRGHRHGNQVTRRKSARDCGIGRGSENKREARSPGFWGRQPSRLSPFIIKSAPTSGQGRNGLRLPSQIQELEQIWLSLLSTSDYQIITVDVEHYHCDLTLTETQVWPRRLECKGSYSKQIRLAGRVRCGRPSLRLLNLYCYFSHEQRRGSQWSDKP